MSALGDVIVDALKEFLRAIFSPVTSVIEKHAGSLLSLVVGTPHPNAIFTAPTTGAWPRVYDYYWGTIIPLAMLLWALMIGLVIFFESSSHLFSSYHRSKLKKRAFSGLLGILSWWWIAALSLRFTDALTGFLVPNLSEVSLFQTLSFSTMGVLGLVVALLSDLTLFLLIGLIYFTRHLALYLFVLLMPLLIVFWVPGVGPFTLVSRFMQRLAGFFVPFLFMTVPVALLFRLGELLGGSFSLSMGGIGAWLTALVIPLIAVISPFFLFWQAGAIFFMGDRMARHVSSQRAVNRVSYARANGQTAAQGGRNFVRGVRGEPARRPDGQYLLGSGNSRAHAVGARLSPTRASTPSTASGADGGGNRGIRNSGPQPDERTSDFETLRSDLRRDGQAPDAHSTRDPRDDDSSPNE